MRDTSVNATEATTEATTEVSTATAKKAPAKNATPSDKTIIQRLKAEAKAQEAKIKELEEALEIQQSKNITVFNQYQQATKELSLQREKFSNSKSALLQTIDGALRAFTNF